MTVLKLLLPYLLRYLAKRTANHLNARRARRLASPKETGLPPQPGECPPVADSQRALWFGLSGVLIGSAFGFALARLIEPEHRGL